MQPQTAKPPRNKPPRKLSCTRCGTPFECGLNGDCWCAAEPYKLPMKDAAVEDCFCPDCLRKAAALQEASEHS